MQRCYVNIPARPYYIAPCLFRPVGFPPEADPSPLPTETEPSPSDLSIRAAHEA